MSFMSWLFGGESKESKSAKESEKTEEGKKKRRDSTRSLIERLKEEPDASTEESKGDTQRFIKAELDAAAEADAKRVEQAKETDEKVEEHRKRADTVMRKVAEKTYGLSDVVVRRKNGERAKKKALTEEEQKEAKQRGLEQMRKLGWRET